MLAILDPFSGIAGDMMLGALVEVGLDPHWLEALPKRLSLPEVKVRITKIERSHISCTKVDFDIPPQPHARHIDEIASIVRQSDAPESVKSRALETFHAIATVEGAMHSVPPEQVHLHEVGAVDAILDVVGSIWGLQLLGVERLHCGTISLGDGTVRAAHGVLPVPAPATLRLLAGHAVRMGPPGSGELVTPTGAALIRVLSEGPPPNTFVPVRDGFGAGTKELAGRPNALRIVLADFVAAHGSGLEYVILLATDIDDMTPEHIGVAADAIRSAGALDVTLSPVYMKKGRLGTRVEVLASPSEASRLEQMLFAQTTTLGIRRTAIERTTLRRAERSVRLLDHDVRVKVATLPNGERRVKPELEDLKIIARVSGRPVAELAALALTLAERE
ncbi:MAG: nickel pincer cofactor biosynthesis protein LarC [Gemmatimonadaceae bacterium]